MEDRGDTIITRKKSTIKVKREVCSFNVKLQQYSNPQIMTITKTLPQQILTCFIHASNNINGICIKASHCQVMISEKLKFHMHSSMTNLCKNILPSNTQDKKGIPQKIIDLKAQKKFKA